MTTQKSWQTMIAKFPKQMTLDNGDVVPIKVRRAGSTTERPQQSEFPLITLADGGDEQSDRQGSRPAKKEEELTVPFTAEVIPYVSGTDDYQLVEKDVSPGTIVVTGFVASSPVTFTQGVDYEVADTFRPEDGGVEKGYDTIRWLAGQRPDVNSSFTVNGEMWVLRQSRGTKIDSRVRVNMYATTLESGTELTLLDSSTSTMTQYHHGEDIMDQFVNTVRLYIDHVLEQDLVGVAVPGDAGSATDLSWKEGEGTWMKQVEFELREHVFDSTDYRRILHIDVTEQVS